MHDGGVGRGRSYTGVEIQMPGLAGTSSLRDKTKEKEQAKAHKNIFKIRKKTTTLPN